MAQALYYIFEPGFFGLIGLTKATITTNKDYENQICCHITATHIFRDRN